MKRTRYALPGSCVQARCVTATCHKAIHARIPACDCDWAALLLRSWHYLVYLCFASKLLFCSPWVFSFALICFASKMECNSWLAVHSSFIVYSPFVVLHLLLLTEMSITCWDCSIKQMLFCTVSTPTSSTPVKYVISKDLQQNIKRCP